MKELYQRANPAWLVFAALIVIILSIFLRVGSGHDFPVMNLLYLLIAPAIYFLPGIVLDKEQAGEITRKLLWIMLFAVILVLAGEIFKVA